MKWNEQFRNELSRIASIRDIDRHVEEIENLGKLFCHSIRRVISEVDERSYNCFAFAFLVHNSDRVSSALGQLTDLDDKRLGSAFVKMLIDRHIIQEGPNGDVVVYFSGAEPVHAGRISHNKRVTSKWGSGLLWEHNPWDIPSEYGDSVRFYSVAGVSIEDEFERWEPTMDEQR